MLPIIFSDINARKINTVSNCVFLIKKIDTSNASNNLMLKIKFPTLITASLKGVIIIHFIEHISI